MYIQKPSSNCSVHGGLPEWSNGTVSKTVDGVIHPWVRIPHPLPDLKGGGSLGLYYR